MVGGRRLESATLEVYERLRRRFCGHELIAIENGGLGIVKASLGWGGGGSEFEIGGLRAIRDFE